MKKELDLPQAGGFIQNFRKDSF